MSQKWFKINIVIMKVSYGLVLSLLLSVILSLSKVKRRQKINSQDHLATWTVMLTINRNIRQSCIHSHCERSPLVYDINLVSLPPDHLLHERVLRWNRRLRRDGHVVSVPPEVTSLLRRQPVTPSLRLNNNNNNRNRHLRPSEVVPPLVSVSRPSSTTLG